MAEITKYIKVDWNNISKIFGISQSNISSVMGIGAPAGAPAGGDRGVFGGGVTSIVSNIIDYITISTLGGAVDFGDLTLRRFALAATSNGTNDRGVFGGGADPSSIMKNIIDYITISTPGDATDFGDLTGIRRYSAAHSNGDNNRGVFGGGQQGGTLLNIMDYITISTTGNAVDFGDLTVNRYMPSATSNGTNDRGVFGGGRTSIPSSTSTNVIDYITISSASNAANFGDLTLARYAPAATSNGTNGTGVFGGGKPTGGADQDLIDYITISSTGDATDFGDLASGKAYLAATSNGTNDRGVFGGGGGSTDIIIDYITISTPGNAVYFGDLTYKKTHLSATSNA